MSFPLWWAVHIQIAWLPTQILLESIRVNRQVLMCAEDVANTSQEWERSLMLTCVNVGGTGGHQKEEAGCGVKRQQWDLMKRRC